MPRRRGVPRREVTPDPVYQSAIVSRFINVLMRGGKKSTSERIFYNAMDIVRNRTKDDPLKIFKKAVDTGYGEENVMALVKVLQKDGGN